MVQLTRLDGSTLFLSVTAIAAVEETPSTVIRMREGEVVRVKEAAVEVVERIVDARAAIVARGIERALHAAPALAASLNGIVNAGT